MLELFLSYQFKKITSSPSHKKATVALFNLLVRAAIDLFNVLFKANVALFSTLV